MKTIPDWEQEAEGVVLRGFNGMTGERWKDALAIDGDSCWPLLESIATALRDAYRRGQADQRDAERRVAETPVTEGRCECGKPKCGLELEKGTLHAVHDEACHGSCRVAGGKSGEEIRREALDEAIAVAEKYAGVRSEIGALFETGWNTGAKAILAALKELANR